MLNYLAFFLLVFVFGGPLLEEPGWRGFALPRLERLHGALVGTIVLFVVIAVAFAIVITWVFNNTRASLLLAMLVHASIDTFGSPLGKIFPAPAASSSLPMLAGFGALAVVLTLFTRGRLGYRPDAAAAPRVR